MSKYTTEVRFICETYAGLDESKGQGSVKEIIEKARPKVFDFDFPMFDEGYRPVLETKILKHYYTREIGLETVGLWKQFMDMKLNEIMPYYNQLYKSAELEFNPFNDTDITTTSNRKLDNNEDKSSSNTRTDDLLEKYSDNSTRTDNLSEKTSDNSTRTDNLAHHDTTTGTDKNTDRYSDTPQGGLTGIESDTYLTNARIVYDENSSTNDGTNTGTQTVSESGSRDNTGTQKNDTTGNRSNTGTQKSDGTENSTFSSTDDYLEHIAGKRGGESYSKLLAEYRKTFLNIDMQIIGELGDLFMNLW